jgi:hypothetical protein
MTSKKYRISITEGTGKGSTSYSPIDVDNLSEFIKFLKEHGVKQFSLKYHSIIDDIPDFHERGLSINDFKQEHFDWLVEGTKHETRHFQIDYIDNKSKLTDFDLIVFDSIRKSINRFRERPLYFFTESDIHSFLQSDLMQNNSKLFIHSDKNISLVHLEYPTNFRYQKDKLIEGYDRLAPDPLDHETSIRSNHGDRGNFDLVILNPEFIERITQFYSKDNEYIAHIINKDKNRSVERINNHDYNCSIADGQSASRFHREIKYAIEVKYIHRFNATNKNMLEEIVKDNEKLRLALWHSNKFLRPINLIFCSTLSKERSDKKEPIIERIKNYITNGKTSDVIKDRHIFIREGILNILIESYFDDAGDKKTDKPIAFCYKPQQWALDLCEILKIEINETYNS